MNPYEILGVAKNASDSDIKKAYKKLVLKFHPDKQHGKTDEEKKKIQQKMSQINEAYSILSDPKKKQQYDTFGTTDYSTQGFNPFSGHGPSMEEILNMFRGDFFNHGFGQSYNQGYSSNIKNGTSIQMKIPLTIEEWFNGCKKKVKYTKHVRCSVCHGAGGSGIKTCPTCNGAGMVTHQSESVFGYSSTSTVCPTCNGQGSIVEKECTQCHGTGFTSKECVLNIEFPAFVEEGNSLKYTGAGNESTDTRGKSGDFYAIPVYRFDTQKWSIQGNNLVRHLKVPYYDCILGGNFEVTLLDKTKKKFKLEPCTKDGHTIYIGKIQRKNSQYGLDGYINFYIEILYGIPKELNEEDKMNLLEIKKRNTDKN